MADVTVQVRGLKELEKKLGGSVLYEDETEAGLDTIMKRMLRPGKGLAGRANTLTHERLVLSRRVMSSTAEHYLPGRPITPENNPRTSGRRWRDYQVNAVFKVMAPRVVRSIIKKINQRWAAENPS